MVQSVIYFNGRKCSRKKLLRFCGFWPNPQKFIPAKSSESCQPQKFIPAKSLKFINRKKKRFILAKKIDFFITLLATHGFFSLYFNYNWRIWLEVGGFHTFLYIILVNRKSFFPQKKWILVNRKSLFPQNVKILRISPAAKVSSANTFFH